MVRIGLFLYIERGLYQWELITGTQSVFQKKGRMEMKEIWKVQKILDELQTTEQDFRGGNTAALSEHAPRNWLAAGKRRAICSGFSKN